MIILEVVEYLQHSAEKETQEPRALLDNLVLGDKGVEATYESKTANTQMF